MRIGNSCPKCSFLNLSYPAKNIHRIRRREVYATKTKSKFGPSLFHARNAYTIKHLSIQYISDARDVRVGLKLIHVFFAPTVVRTSTKASFTCRSYRAVRIFTSSTDVRILHVRLLTNRDAADTSYYLRCCEYDRTAHTRGHRILYIWVEFICLHMTAPQLVFFGRVAALIFCVCTRLPQ